jgi:hypothetical protein
MILSNFIDIVLENIEVYPENYSTSKVLYFGDTFEKHQRWTCKSLSNPDQVNDF